MISVPDAGLLPRVLRPIRVFELADQFRGKTVRVHRERLLEDNAGHLPVACRGIFPGRRKRASAVGAGRMLRGGETRERLDVGQAETS